MAFKDELTWINAVKSKREDDFHSRYEKAVENVLDEIKKPALHENIIGGRRTKGKKTAPKVSPNDRELVLGNFQLGTSEDVNAAMKAASAAFEVWSETDYVERVQVFERAADLFHRNKYELAAALTLDNGKNRYEALADIDEAIDFLRYYANQMRLNDGYEHMLSVAYEDERSYSILKPYGVWSVICPFNFPVAISLGMACGAMITGNTIVLKPSSTAPFALYRAYQLLEQAGLPPGVANYIAGSGKEVGAAMTSHPAVEGIVFTGSKDVGFEILRSSLRSHPIPVIAEMGSKNPVIVTKNADLEYAVKGVIGSTYGYGGQKCSASSRLYVHKSLLPKFEAMLVEAAKLLKVKDPVEKDCSFGPVIEEKKVKDYEDAAAKGSKDGKVLIGGKRVMEGKLARGNYVQPMIISGLPHGHELMTKELFLPVLCTQPFDTLEEALDKANSSAFGLTAGIFTEEDSEIELFFERIKSGVVYANRRRGACTGAMVGAQAFTGWKASGSTGKGTGSFYYLQQFLREQTRTTAW
ncbi:MAG: aldehyde dehydrogenase family protein [Methanomassiliicoccales archaeon]|nr:aldehyde dehydrogenase family protein [Methanomassiliicoccales archaeon]